MPVKSEKPKITDLRNLLFAGFLVSCIRRSVAAVKVPTNIPSDALLVSDALWYASHFHPNVK